MKLYDLFYIIKNKQNWNETGDKVNWVISKNTENGKTRILLLFEDSNGNRDWLNNLDFFSSIYSKVYKNQYSKHLLVHRGFARAYKSAKDEIMKDLLNNIDNKNDNEIIIAGWSHGGALAQLAAEDFNFRTRKNIEDVDSGLKAVVVTFGSPKILIFNTTANYIRSCCKEIIEVSQHNDIITKMPPFFKFKHISKKLNCVGSKFSLSKIFKPQIYHASYDDKNIYKDHEFENIDV